MAGAPPALLPAPLTTLGAPALGAPAVVVPVAPANDWFVLPGFSVEAEQAAKQAKTDKATERLSMKRAKAT
jgi:hypothetical protein